MLICSSSTLLIISARHQRCSLSSHHTAPITDHQSLLFINTAAKQPLVNTSSAGPSMLVAATLGDTSEDCHHHHCQEKV